MNGQPRRPPGPPPPPQQAAPPPPFRVDREKARLTCLVSNTVSSKSLSRPHFALVQTCPLLLRVFPRLGGHHAAEDFPFPAGPLPAEEFQIYTWPDATLGELADLVRAVPPARDRPGARLSFSLVYPDRNGKATLRPIGTVFAKPVSRGGEDERKTLHSVRFQTGDYLDVGILDFRA